MPRKGVSIFANRLPNNSVAVLLSAVLVSCFFEPVLLFVCPKKTKENDSTGLCYYEPMSNDPHTTVNPLRIASLVEEHLGVLATTVRADYLSALEASVAAESDERGRSVLEQLLENARIASSEGFPLCQDTGYVWVYLEVHDPALCVPGNVFAEVNAAVARASEAAGLRKSLLKDALIDRTNTNTNTPAFCEVVLSPRKTGSSPAATLHIMLKGGGSDNASALTMLPPGAGLVGVMDFVVERVSEKGANACPPLVIGVGVGGSFDKVAGLAKRALLRKIGTVHPQTEIAALETELLARINALGIGPGGLGGSTTALAAHIESAPCHIAALPVAVNIGCTALRSASIPL